MSKEAFRPFCYMSSYVMALWYFGVEYSNDLHCFSVLFFFFLIGCSTEQRQCFRWEQVHPGYTRISKTVSSQLWKG